MLVGVTGRPIAHSLSPQLHVAGAASLGKQVYSCKLIADSAEEVLTVAKEVGFSGLNVTSPFKEPLTKLLKDLSPEAQSIGAVNTILFEDGKGKGFNTDVYGIKKALAGVSIQGRAIVLGAGGAAKAACQALKELGVTFSIINRTKAKAEVLAKVYSAQALGFEEAQNAISSSVLIINTLSTLERPFPAGLLKSDQILLDAHYKKESEIAAEAKRVGVKVIDGSSWLIYQGLEAQRIFFGNTPSFESLAQSLRPQSKESIALIGLMGSGKSVVGKILAEMKCINFIDLDKQIEKKSAKSIQQIFEEQGEEAFRGIEAQELASLSGEAPHILSCGGGIVLSQENREFLRQNYNVIWLWAKPSSLKQRLSSFKDRPLLKGDGMEAKLKDLLEIRKDLYAATADMLIATDDRTEDDVVERIYEEIR